HASIGCPASGGLRIQFRSNGTARAFTEQAVGCRAHPAVWMFQHFDKFRRVARIELKRRKRLRLLVLNAVEPGEMMIAVGPGGGIVRAMCRAARVVVHGDLV